MYVPETAGTLQRKETLSDSSGSRMFESKIGQIESWPRTK